MSEYVCCFRTSQVLSDLIILVLIIYITKYLKHSYLVQHWARSAMGCLVLWCWEGCLLSPLYVVWPCQVQCSLSCAKVKLRSQRKELCEHCKNHLLHPLPLKDGGTYVEESLKFRFEWWTQTFVGSWFFKCYHIVICKAALNIHCVWLSMLMC